MSISSRSCSASAAARDAASAEDEAAASTSSCSKLRAARRANLRRPDDALGLPRRLLAVSKGCPRRSTTGQYLIHRRNRDERRTGHHRPVAVARGRMSEPLVNRLLNDVGDNPTSPILSTRSCATWEYWQQHRRDGETLGIEHYEGHRHDGAGALAHADEAGPNCPTSAARAVARAALQGRSPRRGAETARYAAGRLTESCAAVEGQRRRSSPSSKYPPRGPLILMPPPVVSCGRDVIDISHES